MCDERGTSPMASYVPSPSASHSYVTISPSGSYDDAGVERHRLAGEALQRGGRLAEHRDRAAS